jgi:hypothetical protein
VSRCYGRPTRKAKEGNVNGSLLGAGGLAGTGVGLVTVLGLTFSQVRLLTVSALILFVAGAALIRLTYRRRKTLSYP